MKEVAIGECCEIVNGSTPSRNKPEFWNGDIHWFTPKDLSKVQGKYVDEAPEKITDKGYKSCSTNMLAPYSLLFTSRAPIGHLAINRRSVCTNQGFKSLIPNENVDVNYLYYIIKKMTPRLKDLGNGATFKELSKATISKVKIPLPPLPTQKHIAAILDEADKLRQLNKQLIEKYDQLTQSLFFEMFGDPTLNPHDSVIIKMSEACEIIFLGLTSKVDYVEENCGYPLIRAKDINTGYLKFEKVRFISEQQHRKITVKRISQKGDVLISKSGSLGTCAIVDTDREFSTYESIFTVRPRRDLLLEDFLIALMRNSRIQQKLIGGKVGGTVAHLNLKMFRNFEIPLPELSLQQEFVKRAISIDFQKEQAKESMQRTEELFQNLIQQAFKGELTI